MGFPDILIKLNKTEPFSWTLGYEGLSWEQLVQLENQLRFALKSVEKTRSKSEKQTSSIPEIGTNQSGGNSVSTKKQSIEQCLDNTAKEIREKGPLLATWLDSKTYHRKLQLDSPLAKTFMENVKDDCHNLQPIARKEWRRSIRETMLWLVFKNVSLAHALLVLCSFSTSCLDQYTFEEITSIVEYVAQNRESLYCEALGTEAKKIISGKSFP